MIEVVARYSSLLKIVSFIFLGLEVLMVRWWRGWVGSWVFCQRLDAWSFRWFASGRTLVSACRCWMCVSDVQPVAILSAVFWVTWSLFRFVSLMIGDQIVLPYSMIGLTVALYVAIRVGFCLPHVVPFRAFKILIFLSAFSFVLFTWSLKVKCGSRVSPRILGFLTVGMIVLLMVKSRIVLNSAWCGVKSVA